MVVLVLVLVLVQMSILLESKQCIQLHTSKGDKDCIDALMQHSTVLLLWVWMFGSAAVAAAAALCWTANGPGRRTKVMPVDGGW